VIILQFAIPYDKYPLYVKNIILLLFVSLPLVLIAILIATNIIISRSLAQIKIVLDEVKDAKMGNPFLKIQKTDVAKEIDELIDTFNTLLEKIHLSHKKVREFGQNASHELKTPLTIIKGEVDVGLRRDRDGDEYKNILKIVQSEVFHLQDIIEKILFLSNNDENMIKESFAEDSILRVIQEVLDEKKTLANAKNIEIVVLEMVDVRLFVNSIFLKIAIGNLVENAVKYSKNNSKIEISLTKDSLSIKDFGLGISKEDIENIFDRFYRVDKVRSNASGSGLGLSIVKTIVDIHGFNIFVDSVEGKYTLFNIVFHK
jgi:signal transduction histidine kinase